MDVPEITLADLSAVPPVRVDAFGNDDAVALGEAVVAEIRRVGANLAVDVVVQGDLVFRAKLGTTGPGNDEWLAGKAAAAVRYGVPSLLVRLRREAGEKLSLTEAERGHGGSIPIFVGDALVATVTCSGEPDVVDHVVCAAGVARWLGER